MRKSFPVLVATSAVLASGAWWLRAAPATQPAAATQPTFATRPADAVSMAVPASRPTVSKEVEQAIDRAIGQLSDPDWKVRERAQSEIVRIGAPANAALERALHETKSDETRNAARTALKQIEENRASGTSYVTLSLNGVSAKSAFEALAVQSGTTLRPFPDNLWSEVTATKVTLDVQRRPFWEAARELAKQTQIAPTEVNGETRLVNMAGSNWLAGRHVTVAGAFLLVANSATLNRSINYDLEGEPAVEEDFSLQLTAYPEPKLNVLNQVEPLILQEAIDEKGNSLLPEAKQPGIDEDFGVFGHLPGSRSFPMTVQLQRGKNAGTRLARLRGTVGFRVQVESQLIEIRDLKGLNDATRVVNGTRVTFNSLKKDPDQFLLKVTIHIDPNKPEAWDTLQQTMARKVKLLDAKGQPLDSNGISESEGDNGNQMRLTLSFSQSFRPEDGRQSTEPVRMVWEVPTRTRDVSIPFELRDLKLP